MTIHAWHGAFGHPSDWDGLRGQSRLAAHHFECPPLWDSTFDPAKSIASDAPCVVMGYSLGARLVLQTLPSVPTRQVSGVVLISCHPGLTTGEECEARLANDAKWLEKWRDWPVSQFLEAWESQPVLRGPKADIDRRIFLSEMLKHYPGAGNLALDTWSLARQPDMRPFLAATRIPVLWLTGAKDEKFTRLGREAGQLNALIRHKIVPDCGHRLPWEAPEACAKLIADFIEGLPMANSYG